MRVRVDEAGDDGPAAQVRARPVRVAVQDLGVRADGDEPAVLDGERLGRGLRGVDGVDAGVVDDEPGRLGDGEGGHEEEQGEKAQHGSRKAVGLQDRAPLATAPRGASYRGSRSTQSVTGPSLTDSTAIVAPNTPVSTGPSIRSASAAANASYSGSATSGGAARV